MKQKFISTFLVLSFLLPAGISLFHAFHEHSNTSCHSKTESHVHEKKSQCDQLHFIYHPIKFNEAEETVINHHVCSGKTHSLPVLQVVSTFVAFELDRGPPFINVL
jgi:hypothetical protein